MRNWQINEITPYIFQDFLANAEYTCLATLFQYHHRGVMFLCIGLPESQRPWGYVKFYSIGRLKNLHTMNPITQLAPHRDVLSRSAISTKYSVTLYTLQNTSIPWVKWWIKKMLFYFSHNFFILLYYEKMRIVSCSGQVEFLNLWIMIL